MYMYNYYTSRHSGTMKNKKSTTLVFKCSNCSKELYICETYHTKKGYKNYYCDKKCESEGRRKRPGLDLTDLNSVLNYKGPRGTKGANSHGYIVFRINGKNCMQHRLVVEAKIGRKLERLEEVHHINGITWDNRPENLLVVHRKNHPTQSKTVIDALNKRVQELEKLLHDHGITDTVSSLVILDKSYGVAI